MNFVKDLLKLEPNLLPTHTKTSLYQVAYYPSKEDGWWLHDNCTLWQVWYLCNICAELNRPIRIREIETEKIFGTEVAILNLFSIGISDRKKNSEES